jgi:hypothetical protein
LPSDQPSETLSPQDSESDVPFETLCEVAVLADTLRDPLVASAAPVPFDQPLLSAVPVPCDQPRLSAVPVELDQPLESAVPVELAQPTVSAVPCVAVVVVLDEPPELALWPVEVPVPVLLESAAPILCDADVLPLTAMPEDVPVLSALPVP